MIGFQRKHDPSSSSSSEDEAPSAPVTPVQPTEVKEKKKKKKKDKHKEAEAAEGETVEVRTFPENTVTLKEDKQETTAAARFARETQKLRSAFFGHRNLITKGYSFLAPGNVRARVVDFLLEVPRALAVRHGWLSES